MIKSITIVLGIIAIFAATTFASTGRGGVQKITLASNIELKQIGKNAIQITGSLICKETEYFELERSIDNKQFHTVSVIFAVTEKDNFKADVVLKDKLKVPTKTIYYRLKKVSADQQVTYYEVSSINLTN
jgi:hypothetical protein